MPTPLPASFSFMPRRALSALPCLMAPLSLGATWAVVPGHLGMGMAGGAYFFHWLTKYPSIGPFNLQVGLGILCVLGCALLPLAFGLYFMLARSPSSVVLTFLAAACVIAFLPVLVRLDAITWLYADGLHRAGCALRLAAVIDVLVLRSLFLHRGARARPQAVASPC